MTLLKQYQQNEYDVFCSILGKSWAVPSKSIPTATALRRSFYDVLAYLCLAKHLGRGVRSEYLTHSPEVALVGLGLASKGFLNPAAGCLRQCIELTYKHIYFRDHPVEYMWCRNRDGYREINFTYLEEFLRKTDEVRSFEHLRDSLDCVKGIYGELSRYVHNQSGSFLVRTFAGRLRETGKSLDSIQQVSERLFGRLIVLLVSFDSRKFARCSGLEKRVIESAIPSSLRHPYKRMLRDLSR